MLNLRKNFKYIILLLVLAVSLGIPFFYLAAAVKENRDLNLEKSKKLTLINRFGREKPCPPSKELFAYYQNRKEKFLEYYKSFSPIFVASLNKMPLSVPEPLKFKEDLFEIQSNMRNRAKAQGLSIKEKALFFGFDKYETEIPLKEDMPDLLIQFQAVRKLTEFMIDSKMRMVEDIEILEPKNKTLLDEEEAYVRVFPIKLSLEGEWGSLVEFLNYCQKSTLIFVFSDMHIYRGEAKQRSLKADLLINTAVFL